MNRMHSSFKPWQIGVTALAMLLGSGLATADGTAGPPPQDSVNIERPTSQPTLPTQSGERAEPVRLAWDRVGIMA
jgi:hypothetical protein